MTPTPLNDPEGGPFVAQGGAVLAAGRARGLPPEVVASPARVSVLGLPRPVKGSLRRALPALDRARPAGQPGEPLCQRGVQLSVTSPTGARTRTCPSFP